LKLQGGFRSAPEPLPVGETGERMGGKRMLRRGIARPQGRAPKRGARLHGASATEDRGDRKIRLLGRDGAEPRSPRYRRVGGGMKPDRQCRRAPGARQNHIQKKQRRISRRAAARPLQWTHVARGPEAVRQPRAPVNRAAAGASAWRRFAALQQAGTRDRTAPGAGFRSSCVRDGSRMAETACLSAGGFGSR